MAMESCISPSHSQVVIAYDSTKGCSKWELYNSVETILKRGDILLRGDTLVVLGIMHLVPHPCKYIFDWLCLWNRNDRSAYFFSFTSLKALVIYVPDNYLITSLQVIWKKIPLLICKWRPLEITLFAKVYSCPCSVSIDL